MNNNERRPAPPHGDPRHDDHNGRKKKKKGRGGLILFLLLIIVILLVLLWFGTGGFGLLGKNNGDQPESGSASETVSDFVSDVTVISIEQNNISFGDEACADIDELK